MRRANTAPAAPALRCIILQPVDLRMAEKLLLRAHPGQVSQQQLAALSHLLHEGAEPALLLCIWQCTEAREKALKQICKLVGVNFGKIISTVDEAGQVCHNLDVCSLPSQAPTKYSDQLCACHGSSISHCAGL